MTTFSSSLMERQENAFNVRGLKELPTGRLYTKHLYWDNMGLGMARCLTLFDLRGFLGHFPFSTSLGATVHNEISLS